MTNLSEKIATYYPLFIDKRNSEINVDTVEGSEFSSLMKKISYVGLTCKTAEEIVSKAPFKNKSLKKICELLDLKCIDKRNNNGCLWIVGGQDLEPLMDIFIKIGFDFNFAPNGGKASNHCPAWWYKEPIGGY